MVGLLLATDRGIETRSDQADVPVNSGLVSFTAPGAGAVSRFVSDRMRETVSVLDFIPTRLHRGIREGTNRDDLSAYFQAAINSNSRSAAPLGETIITINIPNGLYHITSIGIRGAVLIGHSRSGTIVRAISADTSGCFMLDAMLDRDGSRGNTYGGGWAENMTIDAAGSGRSGLRMYGGGCYPHKLDIRNAATGLSYGLPIWGRISNVFTEECGVGFHTFHASPGDNGTSTIFEACWALNCSSYGFHITQLYYSSFINCVSQNAGLHNFYIDGDANGVSAVYSLQFIGCATEGTGTPFCLRKIREFTLINPRIIDASAEVSFVVLQDAYGSILDFSTVQCPGPGNFHIDAQENASHGAVLLIGGDVTYDVAFDEAFTRIGATVNGEDGRTVSAQGGFRVGTNQVVGARNIGWTAATGSSTKGEYVSKPAGQARGTYSQAQVQEILDRIAASEARIVAYDAALHAHGLIG